jgi:methylated-DNA-protein-cysteine methyltransferase-like protein
MKSFAERIYEYVEQIPPGHVMTYGQLAGLCGSPRAARVVGGIAHYGPESLPWQRVVNKRGGMASGYPGGRRIQATLLAAEGLELQDEVIVGIETYIWWPSEY